MPLPPAHSTTSHHSSDIFNRVIIEDFHQSSCPSREKPTSSSETSWWVNGYESKPGKERGRTQSPPPGYNISESSVSATISSQPPPFSSLYTSTVETLESGEKVETHQTKDIESCQNYEVTKFRSDVSSALPEKLLTETKSPSAQDSKGESKDYDLEPPPAYSEGSSPIESFTYLMAAAGEASSIITQVQQSGPVPVNSLGDFGADKIITMDLRGKRFTLSRDELLTLPEFVLLSLFPHGLLPEGPLNNFQDGDAFQVDFDPSSLQYMLVFFRSVAHSINPSLGTPLAGSEVDTVPIDPIHTIHGDAPCPREALRDRAGIIILREDLDFYVIPPRPDIQQPEMMEVKRAAGKVLLKQDSIFSGLKKGRNSNTGNSSTEQHLIEMLTSGGFNHDDHWGYRAIEPSKAVVCSLALARLKPESRNELVGHALENAQKLLLFWRKPARRCWWEGVQLEDIDGVEGKLKVWIRRVWTLEMSVIGLR